MELRYSDFYEFGGALVCTTFTARPEKFLQLRSNNELDKANEFINSLAYGDYDNIASIIWKQDSNYGNKLRDVLECGTSLFLISDRFKNILIESNLTGWKSYPVLLYDKKGNQIEGYNGFSIIGRAGNMYRLETLPVEAKHSPNSRGYFF